MGMVIGPRTWVGNVIRVMVLVVVVVSLVGSGRAFEASAFGFALYIGTPNPPSNYSANTGGGAITVTSPATGRYTVIFAGLGGSGGNAQVVAHGTDNTRCKVESWYRSGGDEIVNVRCHNPAGTLTNSRFVVRYGRGGLLKSAYLWADQPSEPSYTPSGTYSFNTTGGTNTITRSAVGTYTVNLPGQGGLDGNVLVTAHGTSSTHCNVVVWASSAANRPIGVRCWSTDGEPADSTFSLAFDGSEVTGFGNVGAFAWAHDATSAFYSPAASYSYNSGVAACDSGANTAGRLSTGRYFMRHSTIGWTDSTAHVTARNYPGAPDYCKVESWTGWSGGGGVEVKTRCFNSSGVAKDSQYVGSYYTSRIEGPC